MIYKADTRPDMGRVKDEALRYNLQTHPHHLPDPCLVGSNYLHEAMKDLDSELILKAYRLISLGSTP